MNLGEMRPRVHEWVLNQIFETKTENMEEKGRWKKR
jgi:hypothetical protein